MNEDPIRNGVQLNNKLNITDLTSETNWRFIKTNASFTKQTGGKDLI